MKPLVHGNITFLNNDFRKEDILVIMSIPLRPSSEDFIVWHFDDKGTFSVK
jgi:hypothetical protein